MKTKSFRRLLIAGLIAINIVWSGAIPTIAAEIPVKPVVGIEQYDMEPRADVLLTYWRTVNGVLQFRIWNATRGRWETEWTNVPLV
jgi:hypothetical protein